MSIRLLKNSVSRRALLSTRLYHPNPIEYANSTVVAPLTYTMDSPQSRILTHCLQNEVPHWGFTERALLKSIQAVGYDSSMMSVLGASNSPSIFHSSPAVMELVKFNLVKKRHALTESLAAAGLGSPAALPSLEHLLVKRLQMDVPLSKQLGDLFTQLALPSQFMVNVAVPELFRLSDDMIYFSNEKDHFDTAWYSKRLGVSLAYTTSKLFMAQDNSLNCQDTIEFARDKLHRIMTLGEYYNNVEEYAWYSIMTTVNRAKAGFSRH
ncbi:ubiquinone biosynthesis protein COQ9 KNAG_0B02620 [Huiozyma naganishii CBS 8797]|uniref:Ubiquinone biosynthesis protein n=1 Tax=Huiozyma naganishii (strain ATCC MYA-139 / BCRC 22969 / CBS 8797 / KCTC 17520 / NBRC 10181 / NCYC 3082 / Yp74L-3) TaxID=1071383 RepID=J7S3G0_HUIN7|nr:hypothetical protein KNAG_0B02620 [Kazachstania naganishii CBS 8797]CCK68704.1 hypothetical protein KNAG_0B02620 [Kazachstania naganishii CBS 8797]